MELFRDKSASLNQRIEDLIGRLSVDEKISQLTDSAAALSRVGIGSYNWWNEALHGVARAGKATVFPQAIGLAATWDDGLIYDIASVISEEARAKYNKAQSENCNDRYYGLTFWSPNINIFRDPRWGRGQETYGEDPYLTSQLGKAFIKGLQQYEGGVMKAAACAKHFAVHSGPEAIRHGYNVEVSKKDLYETYLPAFEACVCDAGVEAVMGAYNAINGIPCCCNEWLLNELLRGKWGFEGHVVSDCGAIHDISVHHKYTQSYAESAAQGVKNGCDLNCGNVYKSLSEAYDEDLISDEELDVALRHTLRARFKLGMFDDKTPFDDIPYEVVASGAHKELCLNATRKSIVLLKNNGVLPVKKQSVKRVAIIGPNADSEAVLLGNYNGTPTQLSTVKKGFEEYLTDAVVECATGAPFFGEKNEEWLCEAEKLAKQSDIVILALGLDATFEGEGGDANNPYSGGDRPDIEVTAPQRELIERLAPLGKRLVVLMFCGGAVSFAEVEDKCDAIFHCWYPGEFGGRAIAECVFGEYSPSGRMPVTTYAHTNEIPDINDYTMSNRTYRYFKGEVEYPFGFGLSYTKVIYNGVTLSKSTLLSDDTDIRCSVELINAGSYDTEETVQLYISERGDNRDLPIRSLKRFSKVLIEKGKTVKVSFTLTADDFTHINENGEKEIIPGTVYSVGVGKNCEDLILREIRSV